MRRTVLAWVAAAVLLVAGPALAAKPVIGYVDVLLLQQEFAHARNVRTQLEAEGQKYEAELREGQQKISEIEARIASADAAVKAATSDVEARKRHEEAKDAEESARAKTQDDYARRMRERRERAEELQKELNESLLERAKAAIEMVARKHGLDAVIDARASLWGALDITAEVLGVLNATP